MARTHHATRTFRLSCGCLRDYPGMALGKRHDVLCVACREAVHTLYSYPEDSCAAEGLVDDEHVQCTLNLGHQDQAHYDEFAKQYFQLQDRLKRGDTGWVKRA